LRHHLGVYGVHVGGEQLVAARGHLLLNVREHRGDADFGLFARFPNTDRDRPPGLAYPVKPPGRGV